MNYCAFFEDHNIVILFLANMLFAFHHNLNDKHYSWKWTCANCYKCELSNHGFKGSLLINDSEIESSNPWIPIRCHIYCVLLPWNIDRHYIYLGCRLCIYDNNEQSKSRCLFQNIISIIWWTFGVQSLINCVCCLKFFEQKIYKKAGESKLLKSFKKTFCHYPGHQMLILRNGRRPRFVMYPFSLNEYANKIVVEGSSSRDLMHFEWSRYLSFKTFPQDSVMTPMRLSQAGFYYTGHDEEVKCFCCGVANGDWTTDETAIDVHRRLSPRCRYINAESTNNIGIHFNEYYDDILRDMRAACNQSEVGFERGATGQSVYKDNTSVQSKESKRAHQNCVNDATCHISKEQVKQSKDDIKHPDYAYEATRIRSYDGWALSDIQNPQRMARAGFFYTGVKDFVRCFHCGVGLKNWQGGDDPMSEHKRWSPACGFLAKLQNREPVTRPTDTQRATSSATSTPEPKNNVPPSLAVSSTPTSAPGTLSTMDTVHTNNAFEMIYNRDTVGETPQKQLDSGSRQLAHVQRQALNEECTVESHVATSHSLISAPDTENGSIKGPKEKRESNQASQLKEQNQQLRQLKHCKICMSSDANMVFLPCGHMVSCQACAVTVNNCIICRAHIKDTVRVYQS